MPAAGIPLRRLLLRSLRSAGRDVHLVLDPIRLALSIPQAFILLAARRPAAILTTGGYVAIPTLLAARALRIPSVLWEGNVVPGRSVRFVARRATVLAVTYPETATTLEHSCAFVTGTPIRALDTDPDEARERFGGRPGERILLVFGGSQAVRRINDAVFGALPRLVERVRVIHVTGDDGYAAAVTAREALPGRAARPLPPVPVPARGHDGRPGGGGPGRRPRRVVHARRGRRVRAAHGDRAVPARVWPPAAQCASPTRRPARPC